MEMREYLYKKRNLADVQAEMVKNGELLTSECTVTKSENKLGQALLNAGIKIYPQWKIKDYSFDFKIADFPILVEVDGSIHRNAEVMEKDYRKLRMAMKRGFKLLRFTNEEVHKDILGCVEEVKNTIQYSFIQPKERVVYPLTIREQLKRWWNDG